MTIEFRTSGGVAYFPGLAAPTTIDTQDSDERAELERLVEAARFFDLPEQPAPPSGAADYQTYTITVVDGDRRRTVKLTDPIGDPAVRNLVDGLKAAVRKARTPRP